METTFVQAFESEDAAITATSKMKALGYKVLLIEGTDQAQLWGYTKAGKLGPTIVGEIDNNPVFVVVSTNGTIVSDGGAA